MSFMSKFYITFVALAAFSGISGTQLAYSKDLGVQGNVYEIVEEDMRAAIVRSSLKVDWDAQNSKLKNSAENYVSNLPKRTTFVAKQTYITWIDPTMELDRDIKIPVKNADGSYRWDILYAKGVKLNPLENRKLPKATLFFDGSDPDQFKLVEKLLTIEKWAITPVEAGAGNVGESSDKLGRQVFYAQDYQLKERQVKDLPALSFQGVGSKSKYLATVAFAKEDWNPDAVLYQWVSWYKYDEYFKTNKKQKTKNKKQGG